LPIVALIFVATTSAAPAGAAPARCAIPREARDIWRCGDGFIVGPDDAVIRAATRTDAEGSYRAGLEAAERGDWRAAIAHFTAAHQQAHLVPRYLYNLGLAHARAGHEAAALAWFAAYQAAAPDATNRPAVWEQIRGLEASTQRGIDQLWSAAEKAAGALPAAAVSLNYPSGARTAGYQTLASAAARAGDFGRSRRFLEQAVAASVGSFRGSAEEAWKLGYYRYEARAAAAADGDLATADALSRELPNAPAGDELARITALRAGAFPVPEQPRSYTPEYMVPITYTWEGWLVVRAAQSGDPRRLDEAARANLGHSMDSVRLTALAATGARASALAGLGRISSNGWGDHRELAAAAVGEMLLLRGDRAGAEQAARLARGFVSRGYSGRYAARLEALLKAEAGRAEAAILGLEILSSRMMGTGNEPGPWELAKFDPRALVAEYLLNRGRTEDAIATAAKLDSLRRLRFHELLLARARAGLAAIPAGTADSRLRDTLAIAAGGTSPPPNQRRATENAVLLATELGAAFEPLRDAGEDGASAQLNHLAGAAERRARAIRKIRAAYATGGGSWGM
jgi:hypothetical protein